MITLTLLWWYLPLTLALLGIIVPVIAARWLCGGDYNFFGPLLVIGIFLLFEIAALGICVGRWLS